MKTTLLLSLIFIAVCFSSPCATAQRGAGENHPAAEGKDLYIYLDEFGFQPPPPPWELIRGNESSTYVFGYYRKDQDKHRISSTFFAYEEEPYGYSLQIDQRAEEFLRRFLWSSYVEVSVLEKKKARVLGGEGLVLQLEGRDPVKRHKVRSKVLFGKRGERVVAFYINQWRTFDGSYDQGAFDVFDKFTDSFRFMKKSFYEQL